MGQPQAAVQAAASKLVEALTGVLPEGEREKRASQLQEGVEQLVDEIRESVEREYESDNQATADQLKRLEEQRDAALTAREQAEVATEKLRETHAQELEALRTQLTEQFNSAQQEQADRIRALEGEKDELVSALQEEYEELRRADRELIVDKLDEVISKQVEETVQRLAAEQGIREGLSPEADIGQRIVELVVEHLGTRQGAMIDEHASAKAGDELAAKNAEIRQLEIRNTTLQAESAMWKKRYTSLNESRGTQPSAAAEPTATQQQPPAEAAAVNESLVAPAAADDKSTRAIQFLSEALSSEGTTNAGSSAQPPVKGRAEREQMVGRVMGRGVEVQASDILRETTTPSASPDAQSGQVVPGTDNLTRADAQRLAGIRPV